MVKVLFLAANPAGTTKLALDEEIRAIDTKIRGAEHGDRLELVSHWAVRLDDLSGLLMRQTPDIVHFSVHSSGAQSGSVVTSGRDLVPASGDAVGSIMLVGADGNAKPVPPAALGGLFRILKGKVRLVVLNACYSEPQARAIVEVIDCAVGMSAPIGDAHAIAFAAWFYEALGYGRSIQDAFDLGVVRLLGEGVANAAELAKLHIRDGVDAARVILVQTQSEPRAAGESMSQKAPNPSAGDLDEEIRAVLRPLMSTENSRQARLARAFAAHSGLLDRINTGGDTSVFLSHLLGTLRQFGGVEDRKPAVCLLLESIKDEVGLQDQQRIERIVRDYPQ